VEVSRVVGTPPAAFTVRRRVVLSLSFSSHLTKRTTTIIEADDYESARIISAVPNT
jgi:hypothetical protein